MVNLNRIQQHVVFGQVACGAFDEQIYIYFLRVAPDTDNATFLAGCLT